MENIKDNLEAEIHLHLRSDIFNNVFLNTNANIKFNTQEPINLILAPMNLIIEFNYRKIIENLNEKYKNRNEEPPCICAH